MFNNITINPIFIVIREIWSWSWGFRSYWKIISENGHIYDIESSGQLPDLTKPKIIEELRGMKVNVRNIRESDQTTDLLSRHQKIIKEPTITIYDRHCNGSANSVVYMVINGKITLLEQHGSTYLMKTDDPEINMIVSKLYNIHDFPEDY
jgi:hypothetical protein